MNNTDNQKIEGVENSNPDNAIHHEIFKDDFSHLDIPEFFKILMANSQISGILIMDKQGTILGTNIGMQQSYGYTSDELVGKNFSLLYRHEDRAMNLPAREITTVLQKGSSKDENYCVHKDGSHIWTLGESVFTKNEKGEIYIIKFVFDINQQKLLEEHLIDSNNKLNKSNKDLETFVYTASHDLKAPIANIEALVETLHRELTQDCKNIDEVNEVLNMLQVSTERFRTTINDLAIIGKEQEEEDGLSDVLLSEIVEDVKTHLHSQISESETIFAEDFSKAERIHFSKKNLRSILFNLISNAIKYRHPERKPFIKTSTEISEGFVLLKVCDNGMGIKEEDKAKIFSMYKRINNDVEGTGVGMSIVARIVNNHGGRIEVDSKLGEGSTFNIYIKQ
ncbi:MAG: ATP-binding protein [Cytophagaceae bacterium]